MVGSDAETRSLLSGLRVDLSDGAGRHFGHANTVRGGSSKIWITLDRLKNNQRACKMGLLLTKV